MEDRLSLLFHPVRLRLIHAMRAGGRLTVGELCTSLPDLAKATIYRQVEQLVNGGIFRVESELKVRGVVERRYELAEGAAAVTAEDASHMTLQDHRQAFTAAAAVLIADFEAYLDRGDAQPIRDHVSYRQFILWLSPSERARLVRDFGEIVLRLLRNQPSAKRAPHVLSSVFFPMARSRKRGKKSR